MSIKTSSSTATAAPPTHKPPLVVSLQKVLFNGHDPTLELDGPIELVLKSERQLRPGVSWTSGQYATEQTLTVLCGNHIIKAEGAFSSLSLKYPSSESFSNFVKERDGANSTAPSRGTANERAISTLQVFFATHDAYSEMAGELETLQILKPVAPIPRPHSIAHIPCAVAQPRNPQLVRPSSAQPPRQSGAKQQHGASLSRHPSGFHPGRFLSTASYRTVPRGGRGSFVRRISATPDMPPPTLRMSSSSQESVLLPAGHFRSSNYPTTRSPNPLSSSQSPLHVFTPQYSVDGGGVESVVYTDYCPEESHQQVQVMTGASVPRPSRRALHATTPPTFDMESNGYNVDLAPLTTEQYRHFGQRRPWAEEQCIPRRRDRLQVIIEAGDLFEAIQRKLKAALAVAEPSSEETSKRILSEHADEFGRKWASLCAETDF